MGNRTADERPAPPKPAFISLPNAVRAAILSGNTLSDISVPRWASSYPPATEEDVRQAWEAELSRTSLQPINDFESEGK